jgi:hypothetical protein
LERKREDLAAATYGVGVGAEELHGPLHEFGRTPNSCSNCLEKATFPMSGPVKENTHTGATLSSPGDTLACVSTTSKAHNIARCNTLNPSIKSNPIIYWFPIERKKIFMFSKKNGDINKLNNFF